MKRRVLRLLSPVVLFSVAHAEVVPLNTNLIECATAGRFNCSFKTGMLDAAARPFEMTYRVSYSYRCLKDYIIGVRTEKETTRLMWDFAPDATWPKIATVSGRGPLEFVDLEPDWTRGASYPSGCQIAISGVSLDISDSTARLLDSHVERLKSLGQIVRMAKATRRSAAALRTAATALDLPTLKVLLSNMKSDLKSIEPAEKSSESQSWNMAYAYIDAVMNANPAVDPKSKIDERVVQALSAVETASDATLEPLSKLEADLYLEASLILSNASDATRSRYLTVGPDGRTLTTVEAIHRQTSIASGDDPIPAVEAPAR